MFPITPLSYESLAADARPAVPNQPEAYFAEFYDTQTYVDNTTITLPFFQGVQNDPSLGNLQSQGQFPEGEYFRLMELHLDAFRANAIVNAADATGLWNDLWLLLVNGRPTVSFQMKSKTYGPYPAISMRPLGGIWGMGYGTFAASNHVQLASNGFANVGLAFNGSLVIPPKQAFRITLTWPAAVNTALGDFLLRVTMRGIHYRPVS